MEYNFIITDDMQNLIDMTKETQYATKAYKKIVEQFVAQRYTLRQELAIQRQRDTKPTEFNEYNSYCEACKIYAKELLGL